MVALVACAGQAKKTAAPTHPSCEALADRVIPIVTDYMTNLYHRDIPPDIVAKNRASFLDDCRQFDAPAFACMDAGKTYDDFKRCALTR